jgi:acyl-CoA synthetase (AMP-forming)/AMP-acid ligase II
VLPDRESERLLEDRAGIRSIPLETFGRATAAVSTQLPEPDRDAPAVVLFTSGTTSRPKAVIHSLNTLTAGARNMARITGADASAIAYLVSPLTSITGVMQMHFVADQHAALVLEDRFDEQASLDRINAHRATLLGGAPVIVERLLRAAAARVDRRIALAHARARRSDAAAPAARARDRRVGIEVARVYGSSEAPNTSGSLPEDERAKRLLDDGALLPGTEVRVGSREHVQEGLLRGPAVFPRLCPIRATTASAFEDGCIAPATRSSSRATAHRGRSPEGRGEPQRPEDLARRGRRRARARARASSSKRASDCPTRRRGSGSWWRCAPRRAQHIPRVGDAHLRAAGLAARKLPEQIVFLERSLFRAPLLARSCGRGW